MPTSLQAADSVVSDSQGGAQLGYASYSRRERLATEKAQRVALQAAGCRTIRSECLDNSRRREALAFLLAYVREGDVLTITKLDRLGHSLLEVIEVVQALQAKGAHLRILDLPLDTMTAAGRSMMSVVIAAAEVERTAVLDRAHEDRSRARLAVEAQSATRKLEHLELALKHLEPVRPLLIENKDIDEIARELGVKRGIILEAHRELKAREHNEAQLESHIEHVRNRLARLTAKLR